MAYQITSMMEGVIERGTARKLRDLNAPIAGKLEQQIRIKMWFIGYTPDLVIGVYVGYDKPKTLDTSKPAQVLLFQYLKVL